MYRRVSKRGRGAKVQRVVSFCFYIDREIDREKEREIEKQRG